MDLIIPNEIRYSYRAIFQIEDAKIKEREKQTRRRNAQLLLWDEKMERLNELREKRKQLLIDMEQEAEIEGGIIADSYGERLDYIDHRIQKLNNYFKQFN